ncbi:MAG: GNAT family N-acetyltransferase [Candidatus Sumerlaeia bacterium]
MNQPDCQIIDAIAEDLDAILALQKLAYLSEAAIYGPDIPPLRQTLDEIRDEARDGRILKLVVGGRIVGSVRGRERGGSCLVGKLIVHPDFQRRGHGAALLRAIEAAFPQCARFELFTGDRSASNLRLYENAGYKVFQRKKIADHLTFIYLEKHTR